METEKANLNPGSPATMIGFPATSRSVIVEVSAINQLRAVVMDGQISQSPGQYDIQYNILSKKGASGSPVFNDECKLIAINYWGDTQINYGILSGYISDLLNRKNNAVVGM